MAFSAEIALNSWFKMSVVVAWDLKEVLYQIYEQKLSYQYAIIGDLATNKLLYWLNCLLVLLIQRSKSEKVLSENTIFGAKLKGFFNSVLIFKQCLLNIKSNCGQK